MPWTAPPCCCPATISGLRIRPQSSTAMCRSGPHVTGVRVDLDDRDVRAERERRARQLVGGRDAQAALVLVGVRRQLLPGDPGVRDARDAERAVLEHHVVRGRLQHPGGQLHGLLAQLVGRLADGVAADLQRP